MALYLIEKSNRSGRWTGNQWWVSALSEEHAVVIGRKKFPSQNSVDQHHARLLTEAEIGAYYREQHDIRLRLAERGGFPAQSASADRLAAYYDKLGQNKNQALNKNVERVGLTPGIVSVAERIDAETQERIDSCYR